MLTCGQVVAGNILESAQADLVQRRPDRLDRDRLAQGTEPAQVFLGGQRTLDRRGVTDEQPVAAPVFLAGSAEDRVAAIADVPGGGWQQACQNTQQPGLALPVVPG